MLSLLGWCLQAVGQGIKSVGGGVVGTLTKPKVCCTACFVSPCTLYRTFSVPVNVGNIEFDQAAVADLDPFDVDLQFLLRSVSRHFLRGQSLIIFFNF